MKTKTLTVTLIVMIGFGIYFVKSHRPEREEDLTLELLSLHQKAQGGDKDSLRKLCSYIKNEDSKDLERFVVDEELRESCAEFKEDSAPKL